MACRGKHIAFRPPLYCVLIIFIMEFNYIHIKQAFRKTYSLEIQDDGVLLIRTNASTTKTQVQHILKKHRRWIQRRIEYVNKKNQLLHNGKLPITPGATLSVLGVVYPLVVRSSAKKSPQAILDESNGLLIVDTGTLDAQTSQVHTAITNTMIQKAREVCTSKAEHYARIYNVSFNRISIKDQKTKWGSCSSKRNLNFNWRLVLCPQEIFDYIVIHEVCHLLEMNHSPRFWAHVAKQCPKYQEYRKWLRNNQDTLKYIL